MTTFVYKDTFVLKAYDEVNAKLDDQMVAVQAMLGSSYMRGRLKPETKSWETKLNAMSELVEELGKCQKVWMQLEPVFASDDIGKTLAQETQMFRDVDTLWKQTMQQIDDEPGIIDLAERDNIKGQFEFANKQLDKITKSLNDYLEETRVAFLIFKRNGWIEILFKGFIMDFTFCDLVMSSQPIINPDLCGIFGIHVFS